MFVPESSTIAPVVSLSPLAGLAPLQGTSNSVSSPLSSPQSFTGMVTQGLEAVNNQLMVSQTDLQQLATGNAENLHQIMIRLEESRISFQLFLQIRNRLLEAYQDVMKMQI